MIAALAGLGRAVIAALALIGRVTIFAGRALWALVTPPLYGREIGKSLWAAGYMSLPLQPKRSCRRSLPLAWCANWGRCWWA